MNATFSTPDSTATISLLSPKGHVDVDRQDIVRCQSDSNYTLFYLKDGQKLIMAKTLRHYEQVLSGSDFVRVHKSHLVNREHIEKFVDRKFGAVKMSDGSTIDISFRKKNAVTKFLQPYLSMKNQMRKLAS